MNRFETKILNTARDQNSDIFEAPVPPGFTANPECWYGSNNSHGFAKRPPGTRSPLMAGMLVAFLFTGLLAGCASLPPAPKNSCQRIPVGPGPEDFAMDFSRGSEMPRILVSSHERRNWERGEIYTVDLHKGKTPSAQILPRRGEPEGLFFSPHGMDIREVDGQPQLYIINHGPDKEAGPHHILVYRIFPAHLQYVGSAASEFFFSPNDLAIDAQGGFYVSNDARSRGSFIEMALSLSRSSVVFCTGESIRPGPLATAGESEENCILAAEDLASANGVAIQRKPDGQGDSGTVFVATSRGNNLYNFDREANGELVKRKVLFEASILDNLFFANNGAELIVASHPSGLDFLRHLADGTVPSPSVIYSVNLEDGNARTLYANSGEELSAASGAFVFQGDLYLSQVFEPFLLRCQISEEP